MREYSIKNKKKIARDYFEIPYIEYRKDGSIYSTGTEDFTKERLKSLKTYEIVSPTGEKTKESSLHKGGRTRWKHVQDITCINRKTCKIIGIIKYGNKINIR